MAENSGDKTHDATPHRREQAREQGQVARSQDLASSLLLLGGILVLMFLGGTTAEFFGRFLRHQLGGPAALAIDTDQAVGQWRSTTWQLATVMLPILGWFLLIAIGVQVGQTGFLYVPQKVAPDLSRIDPIQGFQRIFSMANVVRLVLGLGKVLVVATVGWWYLWGERDAVMGLVALEVPQIATYLSSMTLNTILWIGIALLVLAILDFGYQYWKHEQDLKMTPQEIKEEMKSLQGDPQVLARRRSVQRQLVMQRLNSAVPSADVVVTNPTELAIALRYDLDTMAAPIVVAKGAGAVAQRIRQVAIENGIPVVERKPLAQALYKQVDVNKPVPAEQYTAVAEVLRFVYQLKGKTVPGLGRAA